MELPYIECQGNIFRPCLPIVFANKKRTFFVPHALVDTGSDYTLLPLAIAHQLELVLDDTRTLKIEPAGGGYFEALASLEPVRMTINVDGFRHISWKGTCYFSEQENVVLLGHKDCLEKFDLTFRGRERKLSVLPLFKLSSK